MFVARIACAPFLGDDRVLDRRAAHGGADPAVRADIALQIGDLEHAGEVLGGMADLVAQVADDLAHAMLRRPCRRVLGAEQERERLGRAPRALARVGDHAPHDLVGGAERVEVRSLHESHVVGLEPRDGRVGADQHERALVRVGLLRLVLQLDPDLAVGERGDVRLEQDDQLVRGLHLGEPLLVALLAALEPVAAVRQDDARTDFGERERGLDRRVTAADDQHVHAPPSRPDRRAATGPSSGSRPGPRAARLAAWPGREHDALRPIRRRPWS